MINIDHYHWVWYLIGFILSPRLTIMIWISIYFRYVIPFPLFVIGWFYALCTSTSISVKK